MVSAINYDGPPEGQHKVHAVSEALMSLLHSIRRQLLNTGPLFIPVSFRPVELCKITSKFALEAFGIVGSIGKNVRLVARRLQPGRIAVTATGILVAQGV